MTRSWTTILTAILACGLWTMVDGFKILAICPSASYSHQQPFLALANALASRGHSLTVLSTISTTKGKSTNYEIIDLSFSYRKKDCTKLRHMSAFELLHMNTLEANNLCEEQLFSSEIRNLLSRNQTFDAIIIEQLWFQCYYALVKHYDFPVLIGFLSVGNLPYVMDSVGNPDDPLLNPDMAYAFTDRMSIDERMWNLIYTTWTRIYYKYWHLPRAQRIAERLVADTPVYEIDRNFSLVILGNNHVFGYPKPLLPNVIEIHSLQIAKQLEPLPQDVQEFLDGAVDGAIYFSLGSNLQTDQLPRGPLTSLCNALGSLKQRVLWKHGGDMAIHPVNIKFVKWVPQQAVLAHPRVVAYVMQGGLQSLQEAVHHSVPVVAIPFFGDQHFNARKILDAGIGLTLNVDAMTEASIVSTITEVVFNETYYDNMRTMSAIVKDELVQPMERAVWNVEHVLKFPKSRHLRYHGRDMPWIDYYATIVLFHVGFGVSLWIAYKSLLIIMKGLATRYARFHVDRMFLDDTKYKHE